MRTLYGKESIHIFVRVCACTPLPAPVTPCKGKWTNLVRDQGQRSESSGVDTKSLNKQRENGRRESLGGVVAACIVCRHHAWPVVFDAQFPDAAAAQERKCPRWRYAHIDLGLCAHPKFLYVCLRYWQTHMCVRANVCMRNEWTKFI